MLKHQIEARLLTVIERIRQREYKPEDSLLELKGQWQSDHAQAARQIAGMCNAALGQQSVIVYGIHERKGVVGCNPEDLASWWPQVQKHFIDNPPLMDPYQFDFDGKSVIALVLSSPDVPYLVSVPEGRHVKCEIPWRRSTGTEPARRRELLRLLDDRVARPAIEPFPGTIHVLPRVAGRSELVAEIPLYVVPHNTCVIPFHKTSGHIGYEIGGKRTFCELNQVRLYPMQVNKRGNTMAHAVQVTSYDVTLTGSCMLSARMRIGAVSEPPTEMISAKGEITFQVIPGDVEIAVSVTCRASPETEPVAKAPAKLEGMSRRYPRNED